MTADFALHTASDPRDYIYALSSYLIQPHYTAADVFTKSTKTTTDDQGATAFLQEVIGLGAMVWVFHLGRLFVMPCVVGRYSWRRRPSLFPRASKERGNPLKRGRYLMLKARLINVLDSDGWHNPWRESVDRSQAFFRESTSRPIPYI